VRLRFMQIALTYDGLAHSVEEEIERERLDWDLADRRTGFHGR
jgi:hypothetical protein